jgi:hypothetical protein
VTSNQLRTSACTRRKRRASPRKPPSSNGPSTLLSEPATGCRFRARIRGSSQAVAAPRPPKLCAASSRRHSSREGQASRSGDAAGRPGPRWMPPARALVAREKHRQSCGQRTTARAPHRPPIPASGCRELLSCHGGGFREPPASPALSTAARAADHVPKSALTTLTAGQSPSLSRSSASRRVGVRARPFSGGGQPTVASAPRAHRVKHAPARPAPRHGARPAGLAVLIRVALLLVARRGPINSVAMPLRVPYSRRRWWRRGAAWPFGGLVSEGHA